MEEPVVQYDQSWALNSAYLTPAHMANFRPAYKNKLKRKVRKTYARTARS